MQLIMTKSTLALLITIYTLLILIISYVFTSIIIKHSNNNYNRIKPYTYSTYEEPNRSAENWFYNYDQGFAANEHYVIEVCNDIKDGYSKYSFNYKPTCDKLRIPTK